MAEQKKGDTGLEGKNVEIFLKTPLFRFRYVFEGKEKELLENAVRISGTILKDKEAGVLIKVKLVSNMKRIESELPFQEVFIPFNKVDFIVVSE